MNKKEKVCGNCRFMIPHRETKQGFNGNCKEIVVKAKVSDVITEIHVKKTDTCEYFETKDE